MEITQNQNPIQSAPHKNKRLWVLLAVIVLVIVLAFVLISRPYNITRTNQNTIIPQLSEAEKRVITSQFTVAPIVSAQEKKEIVADLKPDNGQVPKELTLEEKKAIISQFTQ